MKKKSSLVFLTDGAADVSLYVLVIFPIDPLHDKEEHVPTLQVTTDTEMSSRCIFTMDAPPSR